jgi:hypothetical protein
VEDDDGNDNECAMCLETGELILCDGCPNAYHLACNKPPLEQVPEGMYRHWSPPAASRRTLFLFAKRLIDYCAQWGRRLVLRGVPDDTGCSRERSGWRAA